MSLYVWKLTEVAVIVDNKVRIKELKY